MEKSGNSDIKLELSGNIKFDGVSFSYSKHSKQVIKNVSFKIKSGQKIAIVGKPGSGKSTLAKLLVGLYSPIEGSIYFDNVQLDQIDKKHLRTQMGIVPQDVSFFNKSIFENISVYREGVTLEKVIEAIKIAQVHNEIDSMPLKYNTIVSELGLNLSGGQRQRIALA